MDEERGQRIHSQDANNSHSTKLDIPRSNRKLHVILGSVMVVALIISVAIGISVTNDKDSTNGGSSSTGKSPNESKPADTAKEAAPVNSAPSSTEDGVKFVSSLAAISPESVQESYESCDALIPDLKAAARMYGNSYIEGNAFFFSEDYSDMYMIATAADSEETSTIQTFSGATTQTKAGQKSSTSNNPRGTNNQRDDVEEADMTQSNGVDVFIVYGNEIVTVTAATMTEKSRTKIEIDAEQSGDNCYNDGLVRGMLLVDDNLVVFSEVYCDIEYDMMNTTELNDDGNYTSYGGSIYSTKVHIYDTSTMKLRSSNTISGNFQVARAVGPNIVVATSATMDTYPLIQNLEPYALQGDTTTILDMDSYRTLAQAEIEKRLDSYVATLMTTLDCTNLQKLSIMQNTNSSMYGGFAYISSFSATAAAITMSSTSMMVTGSYWYVYASNNTVFLSLDSAYMDPTVIDANPETHIVTFELDGATVKPGKLGKVPGYVIGPNSFDHVTKNGKDYLRVASTSSIWSEDMSTRGLGTPETTSQVTVFEMTEGSDGYMPAVGKLTGLGKPGDFIYAVLFQGDRAFITTFNDTAPFYTIDMTDPTSPKKMGELEVPGFTTYLHAVSDDLILGVGRSSDAADMLAGFQISLFDVSDFSKPKRVALFEQKVPGNKTAIASVNNDAEYDTKAFRYHFATKTLAIPVVMYQYTKESCYFGFGADDEVTTGNLTDVDFTSITATSSNNSTPSSSTNNTESTATMAPSDWGCYIEKRTGEGFDGFKLYKIDATNGISEDFSIAHTKEDITKDGCYGYAYLAPRSLIFGNDIMTMKGHNVMSHDLTTKVESATPIELDAGNTDCSFD